MQFMNASLDKLAKSLSDDSFKYLTKKFGSKNLELLKQKGVYPYEYMNSFKRFNEERSSERKCFYSSKKDGKTDDDDDGKKIRQSHKLGRLFDVRNNLG